MSKDKGRANPDAMDWDDEIEPGEGFTVLPEGLAQFEVLRFDKAYKEKGKLGMVHVAVLKMLFTHKETGETGTKDVELPLHRKLQFRLYQFFTAIGQREHGDDGPFAPNWGRVVGELGCCMIKHRTWTGQDGKERTDYEPDKFLSPDEVNKEQDGDALQF